jgi:transcriptional antiterminator RfaH
MGRPSMPDPHWIVAKALPNHERLALAALALIEFEVFWPRMRVRVGLQWRTLGLFGGYIFVRIIERWRQVEGTAGIASVVRFGGEQPARVPDSEIAKLLARADADGVVRLPRQASAARASLKPGAKVRVVAGPLAGVDALYVGQDAQERELVLMNILGAQRQVAINSRLVVPR